MDKRVIAIHLPQFYPFPENDEWWGKGFTEWRNVASAKPRFRGHHEPHIPSDLGFYDLRLKEARLAQQQLAKDYGIDGFCYYHYWFNGKLIMEKPVEAHLADKDETFPFMLCWANENWHRNWEGGFNVTLIEQHYSREDDIAHFNYLLPYFQDERYIKVDGKPMFCVYRTSLFPDFEKTVETWQSEAAKHGFQLYICRFEAVGAWGKEYMTSGIDAAVEFQPANKERYDRKSLRNIFAKTVKRILKKEYFPTIVSYKGYVDFQINKKPYEKYDYKRYPSVTPRWDNSPRRVGRPFTAFKGSTPALFKKWFKHTYDRFKPYSPQENFIFINAWNEWAEGCHLEPDTLHGLGYLEAVRDVRAED